MDNNSNNSITTNEGIFEQDMKKLKTKILIFINDVAQGIGLDDKCIVLAKPLTITIFGEPKTMTGLKQRWDNHLSPIVEGLSSVETPAIETLTIEQLVNVADKLNLGKYKVTEEDK